MNRYSLRIPVPAALGRLFVREDVTPPAAAPITPAAPTVAPAPQEAAKANNTADTAEDQVVTQLLGAIANREKYHYPDLTRVENQLLAYPSPWVYIAVNTIAGPASAIDFEVFQASNERLKPLINHPIEQLFRRPNAFTSQGEFIELGLIYRLLTGNMFWYLGGPDNGEPDELLTLRSDRVRVVAGLNANTPIQGYMYCIDGYEIPIPRERVIHYKRPNPLDDFYGMSPLLAAWLSIQTDLAQARWNFNFFGKNQAVPSAVVSLPPEIGDTEFDRVKKEWYEKYGGVQRATAIIRGSQIKVEQLSQTHVEMDFLNARVFNKETIFQVYNIPPGALDKNATEANSEVANRLLLDHTIYPLMRGLAEKLTAELAPFWGKDIVIKPRDIRVKNVDMETKEIAAAAPYMSINEMRQKYYGLGPVPWGDLPATGNAAPAPASPFELPAPSQPALPASSGKALPSGNQTIVALLLSLRDNPRLIQIQAELSSRYGGVAWSEPDSFHITLIYAALEGDPQPFYDALPRQINPLTGRIIRSGVFENNGERALYLEVEPSIALRAFQRGLYGLMSDAQAELSPFSVPGQWKAHITLGYLEPEAEVPVWRGTPFDVSSSCVDVSLQIGDSYVIPISIKAFNDVPRVVLTDEMRDELGKFKRYIVAGKSAEKFTWWHTPTSMIIALKAYASVADEHEFEAVMSGGFKGIDRSSDEVDPLLPLKEKVEQQLTVAVGDLLERIQRDVIAGVQQVMGAAKTDLADLKQYFDADFWASIDEDMKQELLRIVQDAVGKSSKEYAKLLQMKFGAQFDMSAFNRHAADYAARWTDEILAGFGTTTKDGFGAILSTWAATPGATMEDLVGAIQESHSFSRTRALMAGVTETTRIFSEAEYIAADEMASKFELENLADGKKRPPFHVGCGCNTSTVLVYGSDHDRPIGVDLKIHTNNSDSVCPTCRPLNGKRVSEVAWV